MATFAWLSLLALCLFSPSSSTPLSAVETADSLVYEPPLVSSGSSYNALNESYIVIFKSNVTQSFKDDHFDFLEVSQVDDPLPDGVQSRIIHVYDAPGMSGYAAHLSDSFVGALRGMPEVAYVEQDKIIRITETQNPAPWNLARSSHRKLDITTRNVYEFNGTAGLGAAVYIIDTGINIHHIQFEGRASWGKTIPKNEPDEDGNGHGTHVAGIVAAATYGMAKKTNVIAVKVLDANGSGTLSDVLAGIDWVVKDALEKANPVGSVINMSLGGSKAQVLDDMVNNAVKQGMHVAVAAGNDGKNACDYSPASSALAVTVGASSALDIRPSFSNFGPCVDIHAPGVSIISTYKGASNDAVKALSGTSMASPHIAGLLAYLLSIYPSSTFDLFFGSSVTEASSLGSVVPGVLPPEQLKKAMLALATPNALLVFSLPPGTPNLLLFNNATSM